MFIDQGRSPRDSVWRSGKKVGAYHPRTFPLLQTEPEVLVAFYGYKHATLRGETAS